MKSPWIDQKSARASASSVDSIGWDSPGSPRSALPTSSLLTVGSRLGVVLGIRSLFLTIFLYHLLLGIWIRHLFVLSILLSRWLFEDKFLMRPTFQIFTSPFQILTANSLAKKGTRYTFLHNWWILDTSLAEVGWYSTIAPKGITGCFFRIGALGLRKGPILWNKRSYPVKQRSYSEKHCFTE